MAKHQPEGINVELGEHEYRVRPQRHAYLKRKLRAFFASLSDLEDMDAENLLDVFTEKVYVALSIFIPDLMPEWEFEGFASEDAMQRDAYNEADDHSPDPPQIKNALAVCVQVNDFDWVGQLKNFIGPDVIRAQMRSAMANWAAEQAQKQPALTTSSSKTSPNSPQRNGASDPESSGTTAPTPATPPQPTSA